MQRNKPDVPPAFPGDMPTAPVPLRSELITLINQRLAEAQWQQRDASQPREWFKMVVLLSSEIKPGEFEELAKYYSTADPNRPGIAPWDKVAITVRGDDIHPEETLFFYKSF